MPIYEFIRGGAMKSATLDGKELQFNGDTARRVLTSGQYRVQWFARGTNGQTFTLSAGRIDKPTERVNDKIRKALKDAGEFKLKVP